jgi:type II secretory ATPase GspE/PulE/Tfp pilus assembly ATPase PilB-like protein
MQAEQIITFVRTVPIFHSLNQDQIRQLAGAATVREYAESEVVSEPNRDGSELFIVVEGELQAYLRQPEIDYEIELRRVYPGDYFGVVPFILGGRSAESVRAIATSRAIVLNMKLLEELFANSVDFWKTLSRSLAIFLSENLDKMATIPFAHLASFPDLRETAGLLPPRISRFCQSLAVQRIDDRVKVAMVNPSDASARSFISEILGSYQVEFVAITENDFDRHAAMLLEPATKLVSPRTPFAEMTFINSSRSRTEIAGPLEHDMLTQAITQAIRGGASDVHFEPNDEAGRIRLRIDGRMLTIEDAVPPQDLRHVISRIKVIAELDITNIRQPQDGRFVVAIGDRNVELRVSVMPCQGGEKVVLRLIEAQEHLSSLSKLIVSEPVAMFAQEIFSNPSGLVLVTGPTGSGKTTTLYAAMNMIDANNHAINIVTIEDPVEYSLPYATQIQVNRELELDFPMILRSILRQDPNVILVGEIRDEESAAIALEAATTGHLVLSSMHTYSTLETLIRLRSLNVQPYLLADALKGVISQKLVPRLCPGFTEPVGPDDPVIGRLRNLGVLDSHWSGTLYRGNDGSGGANTGESGRVGLFELLSITDDVRDLIDRSAPFRDIVNCLGPACYFPFARYGRFLLEKGIVAPDRIVSLFPRKISAEAYDSARNVS